MDWYLSCYDIMEFMLWRGDKQILKYKYECEDDEKNNLHCTQDGVVRMNEERMVRDIFTTTNEERKPTLHPRIYLLAFKWTTWLEESNKKESQAPMQVGEGGQHAALQWRKEME